MRQNPDRQAKAMTASGSFLVDELAQRVRTRAIQPSSAALDEIVEQEIGQVEETLLFSSPDSGEYGSLRRSLDSTLYGFGQLQTFLDDPEVEELWINSPHQVFVARGGVSERVPLELSDSEVKDLVERMLRTTGRRVDVSQPFVDASLPDGSRVHVVIPDITREHWSVNIRKFSRDIRDVVHLVERGVLTLRAAHFLQTAIRESKTILVSGATQAGKTTMLQALLRSAPPSDRVVSVEETFELDLGIDDCVSMQCRGPSLEGTGEVTLRRLVKEALRMRPDRIVVGEVREAEALDLLIALNSGLPGACTIHARSARHALEKLCTLPLLAGGNIDRHFVAPTVASVIDLVVHVELRSDGSRAVREIVSPTGLSDSGAITSQVLFDRRSGELERVVA
jgi:pilus assembly protein CpaF